MCVCGGGGGISIIQWIYLIVLRGGGVITDLSILHTYFIITLSHSIQLNYVCLNNKPTNCNIFFDSQSVTGFLKKHITIDFKNVIISNVWLYKQVYIQPICMGSFLPE